MPMKSPACGPQTPRRCAPLQGAGKLRYAASWRMSAIAALCLILGACCSTPPSTQRTPPANLVQPCPPLPRFEGQTLGELLRHDLAVVDAYAECAGSKGALIQWAKPST